MAVFKLKNLDLVELFDKVNDDIKAMSKTIKCLQEYFSNDVITANVVVVTSMMEQKYFIKGISDEKQLIQSKHLKQDDKCQAIKHTKEMKELTNFFTTTEVNYRDIYIAAFGDSSPVTQIDDDFYYKPVSFDLVDGIYEITIDEIDINDHVLANFELKE